MQYQTIENAASIMDTLKSLFRASQCWNFEYIKNCKCAILIKEMVLAYAFNKLCLHCI